MSSDEENYRDGESSQQDAKKRRIQRACDICRRKKIRCDGSQMPGNRCSNCILYSFDCTYVEAAKKRGPPQGFVKGLEKRLESVEQLLRKLHPDDELLNDINTSLDPDKRQIDKLPQPGPPDPEYNTEPTNSSATNPTDLITTIIRQSGSPVPPSNDPHDDDSTHEKLVGYMKELSIGPLHHRFFGKSSTAMLVQAAIDLKHEATGQSEGSQQGLLGARRPEFWTMRQWEEISSLPENPIYSFPDDDLLYHLMDLYFDHINIYLPLLHRPTFQRSVASGLHRVNSSFGAVVLLVCALGAKYSNDPRVLLDGVSTYHSAGWKWFDQVQTVKKSFLVPPTLYDIQFYSLVVQYLFACSGPQQCWAMIGIGIRVAQDVGAHRRKQDTDNMTVEDEMWKRAFWVLVCLDRMNASSFGRPCAIHDEDFDIDLPIECDDEYWDHPDPAQRFKQPPNKPSYATAFVIYIKILRILGLSLRTIYSINKSKVLLGLTGNQWEQHIVTELNSALNKWVDSVPHYLRWDPNREDDKFFKQSAWLYCAYYYIQIMVHRPFIPSVGKPSPISFPSLAICTNAARSCNHIIDVQSHRVTTPSQLQLIAFTSGIVLLLNIWSGKRNGLSTEPANEMTEVHKCMQILKRFETRWHPAGRLWDILYELSFVGDLPLPNPSSNPPLSNKRERDADSPTSTNTSDSTSGSSLSLEGTRTIAGSRRVRESMQQQQQPPSTEQSLQPPPQNLYTLPVYSEELGRLPVHGQFAFSPQGQGPSDPSGSHFSYWNHATPHDAHIQGAISSAATSASYPLHDTVGGSFTIDNGPAFDATGVNWNAFIGERLLSSSLSTTSSTPSAGIGLHQMSTVSGAGMTGLSNSQAMIDNDAIAMWHNAPIGFDLDDWGTYLSNVSELTHGKMSH